MLNKVLKYGYTYINIKKDISFYLNFCFFLMANSQPQNRHIYGYKLGHICKKFYTTISLGQFLTI